jgi:hypothetical protein
MEEARTPQNWKLIARHYAHQLWTAHRECTKAKGVTATVIIDPEKWSPANTPSSSPKPEETAEKQGEAQVVEDSESSRSESGVNTS